MRLQHPISAFHRVELNRLLKAEIERQRQVEHRTRAREQARTEEPPAPKQDESESPIPPAAPAPTEEAVEIEATPEPEPCKMRWEVAATFYPQVPPEVTAEQLDREFRRVLEKAGIKTLGTIRLRRIA